jgi:BirA family transcriptional regulator, biotin operon repressor / biotin---[acetyl-CoA-carboxylase] ligase
MNNWDQYANRVLEKCDSTNTVAKHLADRAFPHGTWVSSKIQEQGRGRLGRQWISEEGNLFISVIIRVSQRSVWSWIPLTIAVSCAEFLGSRFNLPIKIKWPNDLWIDRSKLGGVLCEAGGTKGNEYIIAGVGINCTHSPDSEKFEATHLAREIGSVNTVSADFIRADILDAIAEGVDRLMKFGIEPLRTSYEAMSLLPEGTQVCWGDPPQKGSVRGLGQSGELLVKTQTGIEKGLFAEDVKILF